MLKPFVTDWRLSVVILVICLAFVLAFRKRPARPVDREAMYNTSHWRNLRQWVYTYRAQGCCERCGIRLPSPMLQLHHWVYRGPSRELPEDVELLCQPCHNDADQERRGHPRNL